MNTYFWRARAGFFHDFGGWQLSASEAFTSNLAEFAGVAREQAVRDENQFQAELVHQIQSGWTVRAQVSNFTLSDSRSLFRNDALANAVALGMGFAPSSLLLLSVLAGAKAEQQLAQPSSGITYALSAQLDSLRVGSLSAFSSLNLSEEFLSPRRNQTALATLVLRQNYSDAASLSLSGGYERVQRDFFSNVFFTGSPENPQVAVERRVDQNLYTLDSISYHLTEALSVVARFELRYRLVRRENSQQFLDISRSLYDNEIAQQRLLTQASALYRTASLQLSFSFLYQQQSETYRPINASQNVPEALRLERLRNNAFEVAALVCGAEWHLRDETGEPINRLALQYQMRGFRFDTPSPENNDDRDEVSYFLTLSDSVRLSKFLGISLLLSGALSRNVFIFRQQSANSTDNYILRLSPAVWWRVGETFRNYAEFGVLANYTVYPFETVQSVRSFSFRQFNFLDSAEICLSKTFFLKLLYDQRIYERAELLWRDFAERPLNSFNDRLMHIEAWLRREQLAVAAGVRVFWRQQFGFLGAVPRLQQEVLYFGPTARITYYPAPQTELEASGWYQVEQLDGTVIRIIPNLTLAVQFSW
ncbi:MAG: hypothetical protein RMI34_07320 [Chloroherpetonaceae bacterium]|nr:hypothetical protein [Chloroherpetonaceae bacterium]